MEKKIKILDKGPYQVSRNIPLNQAVICADKKGISTHWEQKGNYPTDDSYYLCRCGQSANKPFCDGSHVKADFEGKETASKEPFEQQATLYEGKTLNLLDNESLCASMRFCDRGVGVWEAVLESDSEENCKLALEETCDCAAGRLVLTDKEGKHLEPELEMEICLVEDKPARRRGPLAVKGGITLEGANGETYEKRNRMTLCRCGESENMPFCDISHMNCPHMEGSDQDAEKADAPVAAMATE